MKLLLDPVGEAEILMVGGISGSSFGIRERPINLALDLLGAPLAGPFVLDFIRRIGRRAMADQWPPPASA